MTPKELQDKRDLCEREATRSMEVTLRTEIILRGLSVKALAELLQVAPLSADLLINRRLGYWSFRECAYVASALGLQVTISLEKATTTPSKLMAG